MQVVSGPIDAEMLTFRRSAPSVRHDPPLRRRQRPHRARHRRYILALSRSEGSPQRFYSMSSQIRQERNNYYDILEHTQKGATDINKAGSWERARNFPISERQRLVINRMLEGYFLDASQYSLIVSHLENEDPLPALAPMARPQHLEFHQFDPRWEHLRLRAPYHRRHPPGD
jgi:hypothetical protein